MSTPGNRFTIDKQRTADWLNLHWQGGSVCPVCRQTTWNIHGEVLEVREFDSSTRTAQALPLAALTCMTCGHTLLFNAAIAGILRQDEQASPSAATE